MKTQTARVAYLDVARAIGILLVVLGHALPVCALRQALYGFHVPLFFLLSGVFFSRGDRGFWAFLGKKARGILIPYVAFGLISIALFALLGRTAAAALSPEDAPRSFALLPNLWGLLYGNCKTGLMKWNLPLWFLPCLFTMNVLYYGLDSLCRRVKGRAWLSGALALLLSFGAAHVTLRLLHWNDLPLGLETALHLLPFFVLGAVLRPALLSLAALKTGTRLTVSAGGLLLLAVSVLLALKNTAVIYTADEYGSLWRFTASALTGAAGLPLLCAGIGRCPPIEYAGRRSISILCMHKFPLLFCQVLLPLTAGPMAAGSVPVTLAVSLCACLLCLAADWVIRRWFPFLLGEKRRAKAKA